MVKKIYLSPNETEWEKKTKKIKQMNLNTDAKQSPHYRDVETS